MQDYGALDFHDDKVTFTYNGTEYRLTYYPYEPCLYICRGDTIICVLHNAFTTEHLKEAFSAGKTVNDFGREYDEKSFCRVLAAALDSGRDDLDFFYAAKLVKKMPFEGIPEEYKYCSRNTLKHFSLHDCVCSRMIFDGSNIILDMEWMEVLPGHPYNPYSKAHQSKEGRIVLEDPSLDKCTLLPWDEKEKQPRELKLDEVDIRNFEILSFDEEADEDGYKLMLYGELDNRQGDNGYAFIDMVVRYSSSQDMFNELAGESWFEDI